MGNIIRTIIKLIGWIFAISFISGGLQSIAQGDVIIGLFMIAFGGVLIYLLCRKYLKRLKIKSENPPKVSQKTNDNEVSASSSWNTPNNLSSKDVAKALSVQSSEETLERTPLYQNQEITEEKYNDLEKKIESAQRKLDKLRTLQKSIQYASESYFLSQTFAHSVVYPEGFDEIDELLQPTVQLNLHCMDVRELRKRFNQNKKLIDETLKKYEGRYTTKTNATIYKLMVIALEAELQNILYNIRYGTLDASLNNVKKVTQKYFKIATDGNQNIAPTLAKFIGEIEYLFMEAVKIEYEYYVQKERIKEEQKALREQMREEAAERKALEKKQKKLAEEKQKIAMEIEKANERLSDPEITPEEKANLLQHKADMEGAYERVQIKADEISNLSHGKAGHVYVISNLGSFGDHVFKIGMTRRDEPQERIDELSNASVPFPFDVHCTIFSEDAPALETSIHNQLNENRVNKINRRKEFFNISIDELEQLVHEIQPTAEFTRTMLAEQYRQSLSADAVYDLVNEEFDEVFDEEIDEEEA